MLPENAPHRIPTTRRTLPRAPSIDTALSPASATGISVIVDRIIDRGDHNDRRANAVTRVAVTGIAVARVAVTGIAVARVAITSVAIPSIAIISIAVVSITIISGAVISRAVA